MRAGVTNFKELIGGQRETGWRRPGFDFQLKYYSPTVLQSPS